MEFSHVGKHCEHVGCNQQDFLPFKCEGCGRSLCLLHRSAVAHNCTARSQPDMTSVDCPICGKSVKFDRADDPNIIWDAHYINDCTQRPSSRQQHGQLTCFKSNCNSILGPSNTFQCHKCHQKVCLSHRIPEDHNCVGFIHKGFLKHFQSNVGEDGRVGKTKNTSNNFFLDPHINGKKAEKKQIQKKKKQDDDYSNSLKGTAHRRMQNNKYTARGAESAPPAPPQAQVTVSICPFCNQQHRNEAEVIDHIIAFHPEGARELAATVDVIPAPPPPPPAAVTTTTAAPPPIPPPSKEPSTSDSNLFREVCPLCQARFPDAIQLVAHVEEYHPSNSATNEGNSNTRDCLLS